MGSEGAAWRNERRGPVLEVLRALLAEGRVEEALTMVKQILLRNEELERKAAGVSKREGVSTAQLLLLLAELPAANDPTVAKADTALRVASGIDQSSQVEKPKRKRARRTQEGLPSGLRRVDNVIQVPSSERPCPQCGADRECIGHDVTEVVELIPAEVVVRRDAREKLACEACEGELVRAPVGEKVVAGGRISTGVVAQVLVDKYRDGLPLHRQAERFERLGWPVSVQTLADQVKWGAELLEPLWNWSKERVLSADVMHLDATGIAVLDRTSAKGIRLGSLWGYVGQTGEEQTAVYLYASTAKARGQREGELGPEDMLAKRTGYTVADASGLFDKSFEREGLVECGCNMHARRYFIKALDGGDARASLPVAAFKKLYDIEERVKGCDPPEKLRERQRWSRPLYEELCTWVKARRTHEPPSSPLGRAVKYLLNHEVALKRFLDSGLVPIDNGVVERLHVRTALTRKNYLFAGSDAGAERAAIAYSIIGSCRLAGMEPVAYLKTTLAKLSKGIRGIDVPDLMPGRTRAAAAGTGGPL
jgi:transposase